MGVFKVGVARHALEYTEYILREWYIWVRKVKDSAAEMVEAELLRWMVLPA